jgi:hypothetical protein
MKEFHHISKIADLARLVYSLGNCAMKLCIECHHVALPPLKLTGGPKYGWFYNSSNFFCFLFNLVINIDTCIHVYTLHFYKRMHTHSTI